MPVTPAEQARARLIALLRFFVMFALAVTVPTAFAFTFVTVGDASIVDLLARVAGHVAAALLASAFVFFTLVALNVTLAATIGPRAVAFMTVPLQVAAVIGMIAALSMTGRLADGLLAADAATSNNVMWNPAAWFVGVYRAVGGDSRAVFAVLALRGLLATAIVAGVAVLAYPFAFARGLEKAIETEGRRAAWWSGAARRGWLLVLSMFLGTSLERGLAAFVLANLTRSHAHRFLVGSYVGAGVLFALPLIPQLLESAAASGVQFAWFSVPLGLLCWTAAGLRVAMMLPVDPAANWVFKLTEPVNKMRIISTAVKVMHGASAVPLALGFGVAANLAGGAALGMMVFAVVLLTGGVIIELLTLTLRAVPGTCTYRPGQLRLRVLWPIYLLAWLSVAYGIPSFAVASLFDPLASVILCTTLTATWASLRAWRIVRARRLTTFIYEAVEPTTTTTIDLSSVRV
jgi:hypothetical protein